MLTYHKQRLKKRPIETYFRKVQGTKAPDFHKDFRSGFATCDLLLCSGLILCLNVPVFLVQELHSIILNVSAFFGPVSSHFLVVRDANSLSLPQRVAKALPNS